MLLTVQEVPIDALSAATSITATWLAVLYTLTIYNSTCLSIDEGVRFVSLSALVLIALKAMFSEEGLAGSAADFCACDDSMRGVIFSCKEVTRLASVAFV